MHSKTCIKKSKEKKTKETRGEKKERKVKKKFPLVKKFPILGGGEGRDTSGLTSPEKSSLIKSCPRPCPLPPGGKCLVKWPRDRAISPGKPLLKIPP